MNDTYVTLSGVVATEPKGAKVDGSVPVTSFRLAATSRHFDRQTRDYVDGHTTWVTVTCWRALGVNVLDCVTKRDRVVVHGRLRTPEWIGDGGVRRTGTEVEADSVGHDLMFGVSAFSRRRRAEPIEQVGRQEADALVREVELEAMSADLVTLMTPPEDAEDDEDAPPDDADLVEALAEDEPDAVGVAGGRGRSRRLQAAGR